MNILTWIVLGLVAGVLAKLLMPGRDPGGFIITILLGVGGALVGGFIATQFGWGTVTGFDVKSILIAVAGAMLLLLGYRLLKKPT